MCVYVYIREPLFDEHAPDDYLRVRMHVYACMHVCVRMCVQFWVPHFDERALHGCLEIRMYVYECVRASL